MFNLKQFNYKHFRFTLVLTLLLVGACSTNSMRQEVLAHPDYDVSAMKHYRWSDEPVAVIGMLSGAESVQLTLRVKSLVNNALQARGYQLVEDRNADLVVTTMVGAIEQTSYSQHVVDTQRYYNSQVRWTQENDYLRGAVAIVMTLPEAKDVIVWQGSASENMTNTPNQGQETIARYVGLIADSLPAAQ